MLVTPMMTISQGNPIARTIAPPVDGVAVRREKLRGVIPSADGRGVAKMDIK